MKKKIACLGGGSLYFPRALADLVKRRDLEGSRIMLYDLDAEKAALMAALGRRLAREAGTRFLFSATADLAETLDGADFAISSIGGSGAETSPDVYGSWYHAADMHIPARYGIRQVVGDTAGPAGMMMGLRSVPAYLAICSEMERRCPDAVLFSHSNPMAVLCRAMHKHSKVKTVGVCHGVQETVQQAASMLGVPPGELECVWVGTNHFYWILRAVHRGADLTERLRATADRLGRQGSGNLCHRLSRVHGYKMGYPGAGHLAEFHSWGTRPIGGALPYGLDGEAREHRFDPAGSLPSRARPTTEARRAFLKGYRAVLDGAHLPEKADFASEEGIASMISAIAHGRREVCIVNLPNRGVLPNLSPEAVVEIEGVTDSTGVRGITVGDCPPAVKGILEKRFAWQELVVDAAVSGDRRIALQALMLDEMAIPPDDAERMLEELLTASRDMLPRFFRRRTVR
jgi:alpha-galactosidase